MTTTGILRAEGCSILCQPSGYPMAKRIPVCHVDGHLGGGIDVIIAGCAGVVCGSCSGKLHPDTSSQPDGSIKLVGFLVRLFISPKVRRMEIVSVARACEQCFETVFPIVDGTPSSLIRVGGGTTTSLSELPEGRSVRISNVGEDALVSSASPALLAVDLRPQREYSHTDRESSLDGPGLSHNPSPHVQIRPSSRPRSYLQTPENFNEGSPSRSEFTISQRSNLEVSSADVNNSIGALTSAGASEYLSTPISEDFILGINRLMIPRLTHYRSLTLTLRQGSSEVHLRCD